MRPAEFASGWQATSQAQAVAFVRPGERLTMTEQTAKADADQVQVRKEASAAREDVAKLRGPLEAMQTQAAELVRALSGRRAQQAEDGQPEGKTTKCKRGEWGHDRPATKPAKHPPARHSPVCSCSRRNFARAKNDR